MACTNLAPRYVIDIETIKKNFHHKNTWHCAEYCNYNNKDSKIRFSILSENNTGAPKMQNDYSAIILIIFIILR